MSSPYSRATFPSRYQLCDQYKGQDDCRHGFGPDSRTAANRHVPGQLYFIITEYNRDVQGFLVSGVDRIVNLNWCDIQSPPKGMGKLDYLTAVSILGDELIEIIDVKSAGGASCQLFWRLRNGSL